MSDDLRITGQKQSEIVKAVKHLLDMARAGQIVAIGYAVLNVDDDGDVAAGTNAVWTDDVQVREALKTAMTTLHKRIGSKSAIILQ